MAIISINTPDTLEFRTSMSGAPKDPVPYVSIQLGAWELATKTESGIIIDSGGDPNYSPLLSAADARKLAKWLTRAADDMEGISVKKSSKKKHHYEEDDDETGGYKF